jgi:integrase
MSKTSYLWKRGEQWWFRIAIPRPIRHHFPSSGGGNLDKIAKPIGDSPSLAKVVAAEEAAIFLKLFARLRAGEQIAPEHIAWHVRRRSVDPLDLMTYASEADFRNIDPRPARERARARARERMAQRYENFGAPEIDGAPPAGETISTAAEAWITELTSDKSTAPDQPAIDDHRRRVRAFIGKYNDLPLTEVTREMAADFLRGLKVGKRRRNAYAATMECIFKDAKHRGRFTGDNPFADMKVKGLKKAGSSYKPFTVDELQVIFDALPRTVDPVKHTPNTALSWVALISAFSGARLEEIAQLARADIRNEAANGASVWCIDIHNGGTNKLKNAPSARLVPVHSALVRAGFLDYVKALPKGSPLFPGLTRRESKGGKVGSRIGELFRKKLVRLGLKRDGLCFHSFRHTVANRLDVVGVPQSDAARVLGHAITGMSYGTYSQAGPGLIRVKDVIEKIEYPGLTLALGSERESSK